MVQVGEAHEAPGANDVIEAITDEWRSKPGTRGVLLCGSFALGTAGPDSDIDLVCVTTDAWSRREVRIIAGREVEIQEMPEDGLRRALAYAPNTSNNYVITVLMMAVVLFERDGAMQPLLAEGRKVYDQGPRRPTELEVVMVARHVRHRLHEIERVIAGGDPHRQARFLGDLLLHNIVRFQCHRNGLWWSKANLVFDLLKHRQPAFYAAAGKFLEAPTDREMLDALTAAAHVAFPPASMAPTPYITSKTTPMVDFMGM
jgi:hypothetical protein